MTGPSEGIADLHGTRVPVNILMVPHLVPGDWMLLHAGFAIQHLEGRELEATWQAFAELSQAVEEDPS